jgi:outer membrane receptor protein involved in Fe transport
MSEPTSAIKKLLPGNSADNVIKSLGSAIMNPSYPSKFCIFLFLTGILFTTSSSGQPLLETIVVTASRSEQALAAMTVNTDWIDEEDLRLIGATHINESMARIAGTWITRGNGQEHLTAIRSPILTGAGGCGGFLMLQDGIPLRAAGFCNVNELFEAQTNQAQRIEVIKGPGTAVHGSNAMHGVIDVISPGIPAQTFSSASLESGSYDYYRLKASHSQHDFRVDASATSDSGYKDDSGFDQQMLNLQYRSGQGSVGMTTGLAVSNLNQETAGFVQGYEAYKQAGLRRDNPNPNAFRDAQSVRLHSRIEYMQDNDTEVILTPYYRYTDMTFLQHYLPGQATEENGQQSLGVQSSWHRTLGASSNLIVGADLEYTQAFLKETQANATDSDVAFLRETIPAGVHYDYDVDAVVASPFIQVQRQLSEQNLLTLGIRFDYVNYDYTNNTLTGRTKDDGTPCGFGGCRFNRPADREDSFSNWSPKLGFSHNFNELNQIYVSLARGFRAPQATELYRLQNDQNVSRIDSEDLDSIEVGFRGSTDRTGYDISLYYMDKDNVIFRDSNRVNVDNGATTHQGVEVTLSRHLTDNIDLSISATHAVHQYDFDRVLNGVNIDGNDVDTAPRHMGSAQLGWNFAPATRAELEWIHMGSYYTDPENLNSYEGHDFVNLRVHTALSDKWELFFRFINLTNVDYAERADFGFGEHRYFVGNPAMVYVGFEGRM